MAREGALDVEVLGSPAAPQDERVRLIAARLRSTAAAAQEDSGRRRARLLASVEQLLAARRGGPDGFAAAIVERQRAAAPAGAGPTAPRRLRIAWCTPLSDRSAVGEYSCRVGAALARIAEVELWTADPDPLHASELPVVRFEDAAGAAARLDGYDAVVYNIGNYPPFHALIHDLSQRRPGVVILHDRVLHHMFAAKWQQEDGERFEARYAARMALHHGAEGARVAGEQAAGSRRPVWESPEEVVRFPLDQEALRFALGAVTHSHDHARAVRSRWHGPVRALFQPCYRALLGAGGPPPEQRPGRRLRLTTVGNVIPNKNVERVIAVLASDPELASRVRYTVIGEVDPGSGVALELERLERTTPQLRVELLGWQPERELDRLMGDTDVFVNLRDPVMESSSASLVRELAFGRPVLCFDGGSFGELPADAVARVRAGDFAAAAAELRCLLDDPDRRQLLGENARRFAAERDEDEYARRLAAFIEEVRGATPWLALLDRTGIELGRMRPEPAPQLYHAVARELARASLV